MKSATPVDAPKQRTKSRRGGNSRGGENYGYRRAFGPSPVGIHCHESDKLS